MKRFVYFMENFQGAHPPLEILKRYDLEYALEETKFSCQQMPGPQGANGSIVAAGDLKGLAESRETHQWIHSHTQEDGTRTFVGIPEDKTQMPGPGELAREDMFIGYNVKLEDGNDWVIPVFRFVDGRMNLPQVYGIDKDGNMTHKTNPKYEQLQSYCENIWMNEALPPSERQEITDAVVLMLGSLALKANYRINFTEVLAMQLLSDKNIKKIAQSLLDIPAFEKMKKDFEEKKSQVSDSGQTSKRGGEESQDTTQLMQK